MFIIPTEDVRKGGFGLATKAILARVRFTESMCQ